MTPQEFHSLISSCSNILLVVGAGISRSCGIPDFRSPNGLYDQVLDYFPEIGQPEMFFHIDFYREETDLFYSFIQKTFQTLPTQPSNTHFWIKELESQRKLLRCYTQNIDGLECAAGVTRIIPTHGSLHSAKCLKCSKKCNKSILDLCSPKERYCKGKCKGLLKPNIVFFGERIAEEYFSSIEQDCKSADLLLVVGTSLSVAPINQIVSLVPGETKKIMLNKTLIPGKMHLFDHLVLEDASEFLRLVKFYSCTSHTQSDKP